MGVQKQKHSPRFPRQQRGKKIRGDYGRPTPNDVPAGTNLDRYDELEPGQDTGNYRTPPCGSSDDY